MNFLINILIVFNRLSNWPSSIIPYLIILIELRSIMNIMS
jgi:hypothetical protein